MPAGNVFPWVSKLKGTLTVALSNAKAAVALADTAARTNIRIIGRIVFSLFTKHLESLFIPIFEQKLICTDDTLKNGQQQKQQLSLTSTVLEQTTQVIHPHAVNVAADISKVALICQCSRKTRWTPLGRKRAVCELLDKLLPLV